VGLRMNTIAERWVGNYPSPQLPSQRLTYTGHGPKEDRAYCGRIHRRPSSDTPNWVGAGLQLGEVKVWGSSPDHPRSSEASFICEISRSRATGR
jgi:hypothetical protein